MVISRPRQDREFSNITFRDRDETETRNLDREMRDIETETRVSSNSGSVHSGQSQGKKVGRKLAQFVPSSGIVCICITKGQLRLIEKDASFMSLPLWDK